MILAMVLLKWDSGHVKLAAGSSYLSDHPVPNASDQLAMLAIGDQVEVVGKLDVAGQLLQDVYAEAFTAQFSVRLSVTHNTESKERKTETEHVMDR